MFSKLGLPEIEAIEVHLPSKPDVLGLEISEPLSWQYTKSAAKEPPHPCLHN